MKFSLYQASLHSIRLNGNESALQLGKKKQTHGMVWFARYNRVKEKQHASKEMQQLGKYQAYLSCLHLLILEHVSYETKQIKSN